MLLKLAAMENFSFSNPKYKSLQLSQADLLKTLTCNELKPEWRVAEKSVIFGKKMLTYTKIWLISMIS